jgi:hypothetical protein
MRLSITVPQGMYPKISKDLIGFQSAQLAENCKLTDGQLRPWYNYLFTELAVNKGIVTALYLYESEYWFAFEADVDIVPAPVAGDTESKLYYTGSGIPKKTNLDEATTGTGAMPINFYPLAVPTPKNALSSVSTSPPAGSGDDRYVTYRWTIVTSWGEEGFPGPASTALEVKNGEEVTLSDISMIWEAGTSYSLNEMVFDTTDEGGTYIYVCVQAGTSGGSEPTWNETVDGNTIDNTVIWRCYKNIFIYKRIYRLADGETSAKYKRVTTIASTETGYVDTVEDDDLGGSCPSLNFEDGGQADADWDTPSQNLQGLIDFGYGIVIGSTGKDIYPSIPYKPWAYPIAFSLSSPNDILLIKPIVDGISVVFTSKGVHLLKGTSSGSLLLGKELPDKKPCLSKKGAVAYSTGVIYPATDGLRNIASDGTNTLLTVKHYDVETWANVYPSTMHACIHDNKYFGFYKSGSNEGGIVLDLITGHLTTLDFYTFATYVDPETDTLYFLRSTAMSGFSEIWTNPDAASASGKATQYDLTGGAGVMASISQPDYARNMILTLTDANDSVTAISITIAGTNSEGESESESFDFDDFTAKTATGNVAFAEVDSVTINSVTGAAAGDVLDLGWGKKFGLLNDISAESDIIKINENNDDADVDDLTISTTYNTVQFETDPDASNDYQVWYTTD